MAFFKEWLCFKERQCFKERLFGGRLDELDPKYFEINARKILSGLGFADHLVRETHKCPQSATQHVSLGACHTHTRDSTRRSGVCLLMQAVQKDTLLAHSSHLLG